MSVLTSDLPVMQCDSFDDLQFGSHGTDCVQVLVCGQLVQIHVDDAKASIERFEEALRQAVGMEAHSFCFWDVNGRELPNDHAICHSIDNRLTPLQATLVGHAVHDIELQREELAQMQWKVMRDQFTALTIQIQAIRRQSEECQNQMRQQKQQHTQVQQSLLRDFQGQVEELTTLVKNCVGMDALVGLTDRVHSVSQLLNAEANARESSIRSVEFRLDKLDAKQKASFEVRLDTEVSERKTSIDDLTKDVHLLHEKLETLAYTHAQDVVDLRQSTKEMRDASAMTLRDTRSEVLHLANVEAGGLFSELAERIKVLEENVASERILSSENASRWVERHKHLQEQFDKAFQTIEQCRLQGRMLTGMAKAAQEKSDQTAEGLSSLGEATREGHRSESQARDEQIRSFQTSLLGQQHAALSDLETRLSDRIEREAAARAESMLQLLDDMGNMLEKEIPSKLRQQAKNGLRPRSRERSPQVQILTAPVHQFPGVVGVYGAELPPFSSEVSLASPIAAPSLQPQVSVQIGSQIGSRQVVRSSSVGSVAARKPVSARPNMLSTSYDAPTVALASHRGSPRRMCQPASAFTNMQPQNTQGA